MNARSSRRANRSRSRWAAAARLGLTYWFFGNLYEAMVDMPRLLADAQPRRAPRLLGRGSPLRYYAPTAPLTLATTAAALVDSWRSGGDKRVIATAAVSTASAMSLTAYLVPINQRLLQGGEPLSEIERDRLGKSWHRANLARLTALAVTLVALRCDRARTERSLSGRIGRPSPRARTR